ncbi:hypothetical protein DYU05_00330 [Mucilaginibacter terrenus]|uniref:Uncharacterized protein n=1 Tax=Mucilaginibacter terrenus TaxID=2482727 RepID=A0A3E2NTD6_9SPHI|nr:hypothetical protein [Mucilaginibacter terrenus]RFZ84120.1 hypothetical protein DYU05_00330 [Mucilaginibacter terrenus]
MIDNYFKRPLLYDYLLGCSVCAIFFWLNHKGHFNLPEPGASLSTTTDLSTISLTLAGFVLTLLTVLITFKTGAKIPNGTQNDDVPLFDLFFSTRLYFQTTTLLKGCINSLVFISVLGFTLKLLLSEAYEKFLFYSNVLGLVIIAATLYRSLMILTRIIRLQRES